MTWPIRNQILLPFAVLLLLAVAATSLTAAVLAARRGEQVAVAQLSRVMQTLGSSRFPLSANVLQMMRGLSGAEFAVLDQQGQLRAATVPENAASTTGPATDSPATGQPSSGSSLAEIVGRQLAESPQQHEHGPADGQMMLAPGTVVEIRGTRYRMAVLPRSDQRGERITLVALYPEQSLSRLRWQAATPPLAVGGVTLLVAVLLSYQVASRLGGRIRTVQQQVAQIAGGQFIVLPEGSQRDEIDDLSRSVNRMSRQLQQMQGTIARTERSRLLWQLAGGLAHQLRNSVTGARLSIQLHRRRCGRQDDESLEVALRQLDLTETQLKGLLAVGRGERIAPVSGRLSVLLDDVTALVRPACQHTGVALSVQAEVPAATTIADMDGLRGALVNLLLNAAEAAGAGGTVRIEAEVAGSWCEFRVLDSGPGPPEELEGELFELFSTSRPEGTGIGLALVAKVARDNHGHVDWNRDNSQTCFRLSVPVEVNAPAAPAGSPVPPAEERHGQSVYPVFGSAQSSDRNGGNGTHSDH
ncbi:MAG: HAMP domain-containing histidine kinase [Planctomycetaceae bacterium]|nr:HAMP domain-containing histidine kinase [Planctomycetaceae bacterium]